jgi:hypothetical protein
MMSFIDKYHNVSGPRCGDKRQGRPRELEDIRGAGVSLRGKTSHEYYQQEKSVRTDIWAVQQDTSVQAQGKSQLRHRDQRWFNRDATSDPGIHHVISRELVQWKIVTNAIRNIMYTKQRDDEDLVDYTRCFKTAKDFLEAQLGGKLKIDKMAKEDEDWDETNATKMKECNEQANARLMALMYLENADQNKYWTVSKGLMDQFSLDQDQYPKTINHVTSVLSNHKFDEKYFEFKNKNQGWKNKEDFWGINLGGAPCSQAWAMDHLVLTSLTKS